MCNLFPSLSFPRGSMYCTDLHAAWELLRVGENPVTTRPGKRGINQITKGISKRALFWTCTQHTTKFARGKGVMHQDSKRLIVRTRDPSESPYVPDLQSAKMTTPAQSQDEENSKTGLRCAENAQKVGYKRTPKIPARYGYSNRNQFSQFFKRYRLLSKMHKATLIFGLVLLAVVCYVTGKRRDLLWSS